MIASRMMRLGGCGVLLLSVAGGCSFQQKKVEQELNEPPPIHCATADGDIRVLQSEKANVAERMVEGVTAIYPASAVIGLIGGIEGTKLKVAIGEYNEQIEARIAQIEAKCDVDD